eukprot:1628928-Alexandrium_andersonii.AAC.1
MPSGVRLRRERARAWARGPTPAPPIGTGLSGATLEPLGPSRAVGQARPPGGVARAGSPRSRASGLKHVEATNVV